MPVRIVFRGLVLFRIEGEGTPDGRIIADLVDVTDLTASPQPPTAPHAHGMPGTGASQTGAGGHAHGHFPEIQVYTSKQQEVEHLDLKPEREINLFVAESSDDFVKVHPSYDDHCPKLSQILQEADNEGFRRQEWKGGTDNRYVRTSIIVNRGTIRVKDVVTWDAGAFPLTEKQDPGLRSATPALVSFFGSAVQGHMASECVIDIDVDEVKWADRSKKEPLTFAGASHGNPRAPRNTVEILVTNFPAQQERAFPWSLHFLWLLRAAGYTAQSIPQELSQLQALMREYLSLAITGDDKDKRIEEAIAGELRMLGADRTGFPIPYLDPKEALTKLTPIPVGILADPWNLPLCPQGDNSRPFR